VMDIEANRPETLKVRWCTRCTNISLTRWWHIALVTDQ
jgi:hypothetical protein